jgi:hypothetical protein
MRNFNKIFQEFKSQETGLRLFSAPFNIGVDAVPEMIQMELLQLQGNDTLKYNSHESSLLDFTNHCPKMNSHSWWSLLRRQCLCLVELTSVNDYLPE